MAVKIAIAAVTLPMVKWMKVGLLAFAGFLFLAGPAHGLSRFNSLFVFFASDDAEISADGWKIIALASRILSEEGIVGYSLVGHSDRAGPPDYNLDLSRRRMEKVRAALLAAKIPAAMLSQKYVGETQPLVPTPDGVREAQNRRVEIAIHYSW